MFRFLSLISSAVGCFAIQMSNSDLMEAIMQQARDREATDGTFILETNSQLWKPIFSWKPIQHLKISHVSE